MTNHKVLDANSIKEAFDLGKILNKIIGGYDRHYSVRRVIHMSKKKHTLENWSFRVLINCNNSLQQEL